MIYATGAMVDRHLGIPGEDLPGSVAATDFVNWYCGHPDATAVDVDPGRARVAVIGVGNVAVDVARILAKTADELRATDIPDEVLTVLARQRRHAASTSSAGAARRRRSSPPRSCGSWVSCPRPTCIVRTDGLRLDPASAALAESDRHVRATSRCMQRVGRRVRPASCPGA